MVQIFRYCFTVCLLDCRRVHSDTTLYLTTNYQIKTLADRLGYTETVEKAGRKIPSGSVLIS